jgi:isocitrate dehydrogenase
VAADMKAQEDEIMFELNNAQGKVEDVKGYYFPDEATTFAAMRPSTTLNTIVDNI